MIPVRNSERGVRNYPNAEFGVRNAELMSAFGTTFFIYGRREATPQFRTPPSEFRIKQG